MYIKMKNIQQLFPNSRNILQETNFTYCCLTGWIRLENAPTPYMTHLLYVCEYNEALKNLRFIPNMHILCLIGEQDHLEKRLEEFPSFINILFLKNENPEAVYAELLKYFETQCGIGLFADSLLEVLFSEGGVQSMIDRAYNAFNNPTLLS